jgi:small subunit ribosomal protein S16
MRARRAATVGRHQVGKPGLLRRNMVRIRLQRVGAKRQPSYRIVAIDQRSPRGGRALEVLGSYNPRTDPETVAIKSDRALYWLGVGAQPSAAAKRLLQQQGIWEQYAPSEEGGSDDTTEADAGAATEPDASGPSD